MQRFRPSAATSGNRRRSVRRARIVSLSLCSTAAALLLFSLPGAASAAVSCPNSNPVVNENNCMGAGTTANQVPNYSDNLGGFTTQTSYNIGQSVDLKIGVSAPKGANGDALTVQVFRIGYYGGTGARQISSANVQSNNTFQCNAMDPNSGELSCSNWNVTYTIPGSSLSVSGIYEAKITDTTQGGIENYVVFAVGTIPGPRRC